VLRQLDVSFLTIEEMEQLAGSLLRRSNYLGGVQNIVEELADRARAGDTPKVIDTTNRGDGES
jgi:hypothetical protein